MVPVLIAGVELTADLVSTSTGAPVSSVKNPSSMFISTSSFSSSGSSIASVS